MVKDEHNYCLDFVKGIACILVVLIHCSFPGKLGMGMRTLSRFCVPFFFMVSGYFCFYQDSNKYNAKKKIMHIFRITAAASAFYVIYGFIIGAIEGGGYSVPSISSIFYFLIFNKTDFIISQLWFLFALLYDYIIYSVIQRLKLEKFLYYLIPILIISYIFLAQGMHLIGHDVPKILYKNFLIEGLPLFMLGHLIHYKQNHLKLNSNVLIVLLILFTVLSIPERLILGREFGVNIASFPQVVAIFLLCVNNPQFGKNTVIRKIGTKYSMFVYILHPFVMYSLEYIYMEIGVYDNIILRYSLPVQVIVITILLSLIVTRFRRFYVGNLYTNNR